ncbi:MAG: hypothetical protein ACK5LT_11945 [Lachnospirales bacterium]
MKKLYIYLVALSFVISINFQVLANTVEISESLTRTFFEIDNIVDYAQLYGIRHDDVIIKIPVNLSIKLIISLAIILDVTTSFAIFYLIKL